MAKALGRAKPSCMEEKANEPARHPGVPCVRRGVSGQGAGWHGTVEAPPLRLCHKGGGGGQRSVQDPLGE